MPARRGFVGTETLLINIMMIGLILATDLIVDEGEHRECVWQLNWFHSASISMNIQTQKATFIKAIFIHISIHIKVLSCRKRELCFWIFIWSIERIVAEIVTTWKLTSYTSFHSNTFKLCCWISLQFSSKFHKGQDSSSVYLYITNTILLHVQIAGKNAFLSSRTDVLRHLKEQIRVPECVKEAVGLYISN